MWGIFEVNLAALMNSYSYFVSAAVTALVVAGGCPSAPAAITFDTPEQFTDNFAAGPPAPDGPFIWSAEPGVGGASGRVNVGTNPRAATTALYRTPFDLGGGAPHAVSAFFLAGNARSQTAFELGFSPGGAFGGGTPWVAARVRAGSRTGGPAYGNQFGIVAAYVETVNAVEDADGATPAAASFALTEGHWYRFTTTWTYGGAGEFRYNATLRDFGPDGRTPDPTFGPTVSGSFVNAAFPDAASVAAMRPGVEADNSSDPPGPTLAWDNFDVAVVPEPAGLALAAGAAGPLVGRLRRRR